jgi:hypothetical protein
MDHLLEAAAHVGDEDDVEAIAQVPRSQVILVNGCVRDGKLLEGK